MDYNFDELKYIMEKASACYEKVKEEEEEKKYEPLSSFNFFKIISNQYYKENFHSDILKFLLENFPVFLDSFLELIEVDKNNYKNYSVNREEGRIDILIKSSTHAIIIENKMNWAEDQDAQIYRYYKYVKENLKSKLEPESELIIEKIVYLTPLGDYPSKKSLGYDFDKKDTKKNEYIKDIESKLINVIAYYVKDIDNEKKYLLPCLEKTLKKEVNEDREDYRVFLKHYIDILKERGIQIMSTSTAATKFLEDVKNSGDDNVMDKITNTKAILDTLQDARLDFFKKGLSGSKVSYSCCYKTYEYDDKDACHLMISVGSALAETRIFIIYGDYFYHWENQKSEGRKNYETKQNELIEILKEKGIVNDNDFTQHNDNLAIYHNKMFKPIIEDEEALDVALKLHDLLSNFKF